MKLGVVKTDTEAYEAGCAVLRLQVQNFKAEREETQRAEAEAIAAMQREPVLIDPENPFVASAIHMLQLFGSVGADQFDITHTNLDQERTEFRRDQSLAAALQSMPSLMSAADRRQRNIIVRPRSEPSTLIQLDDLDEEKARLTSSAAFLILETSPANFQSWVAVSDCVPGIRSRLCRKVGADKNASGATRIAGTTNYKLKYAPDFPRVKIRAGKRGHIVTVSHLDKLELLAPAIVMEKPQPVPSSRTEKWPSYQQCLDRAPIGDKGHPSRTQRRFHLVQNVGILGA